MPELTPLESSAIKAYGYDSAKKVLTLQFRSGKSYQYADVPPTVAAGKFFSSNINGKFKSPE